MSRHGRAELDGSFICVPQTEGLSGIPCPMLALGRFYKNGVADVYFWDKRFKDAGNKKFFRTPDELLTEASGYFEWATDTPLEENVVGWYQGVPTEHTIYRPRAFTWQGLAVHLGISTSTLDNYRKNEDFAEAIDAITNVIYAQKFEGAAVGLFNSNLIARDLGISEKSEISGAGGTPLEVVVQYQLPSNGREPPTFIEDAEE